MYRIAILGCENSHADAFLSAIINDKIVDDVEVVGVYSDEEEPPKKLNEKFGVYIAKSFDEFVGKVDGIVITARHGDNHMKYAMPYIESGIPMFIDKPITCTEEDAKKFMAILKENNIRISGGSSCVHDSYIQKLKKLVADGEYGKPLGGFFRAPLQMKSKYGGFFFYSQHLVQVMTEIFGCYPKSVKTFQNDPVTTCIVRYDDFDVTLSYVDSNFRYSASVSLEKGFFGEQYGTEDCFGKEFMEYYELLTGKEQKHSYEDIFSTVYIQNAIYRAINSGNEEVIKYNF